jgi:hypothetical protein
MKLEIRNNKDFWSGMMFIGTGAAAIFIAREYRFGTALRMGPGFFPIVLGGILILIGLYVLVTGLRSNMKIQGNWSIRALILLPATIVLFGVLMEYGGFVPALLALIFGAAFAGREFKLKEVLLVAALLTLLSSGVFIWGLGLPYPLIKGF